jgi:hypothetical protein
MSNIEIEIQKLMRRVDRSAARLNPGLSAIAIVLSTCLLGEVIVRLPAIYEAEFASYAPLLTSDPTALLTIDLPPTQ